MLTHISILINVRVRAVSHTMSNECVSFAFIQFDQVH